MVTVDKLQKSLGLIIIGVVIGTVLLEYELMSYAKTYTLKSVETTSEHFKNLTIKFHKNVILERNHSKTIDKNNYLIKENNQNDKITEDLKKANPIKNTHFGKNKNVVLERNYSKNTDNQHNYLIKGSSNNAKTTEDPQKENSLKNTSFGHNNSLKKESSNNAIAKYFSAEMKFFIQHLTNESLLPYRTKSNRNISSKVSFIFALPTVRRENASYLINTVKSLLNQSTKKEIERCLFLIFIAETDTSFVRTIENKIKENFIEELNSGIIEIMSAPKEYYPELTNIPSTHGDRDPEERMIWLRKQNLDYAYLMSYVYSYYDVKYYIQMEDDIIAKKHYVTSIMKFIVSSKSENWYTLEFSTLGFIGKLFKRKDLKELIIFMLENFKLKPCDLIFYEFLDKKSKICLHREYALFQHIGRQSSLKGKIQELKDNTFDNEITEDLIKQGTLGITNQLKIKAPRKNKNKLLERNHSNNIAQRNYITKESYNAIGKYFSYEMKLFIPHLMNEFLLPYRTKSNRNINNKVDFIFAIPIVRRESASYLINTVKSLLSQSTKKEMERCLFIIFIAETNTNFVKTMWNEIRENFIEELKSGIIEIMIPSKEYYPDLTNIPSTYNDSRQNMSGRTKQNLDYIYLMSYVYSYYDVKYYIQTEDDIIATKHYVTVIEKFIQSANLVNWYTIEFSALGFIGKLFKRKDLKVLIGFMLKNFKLKPCDRIFDDFLKLTNKVRLRRDYALFQHMGRESSLKGKTQELKDGIFDEISEDFLKQMTPGRKNSQTS